MQEISPAALSPIVHSFLASDRHPLALNGDDRLAELGIDSLTTLNILMSAAEKFSLDLSRLDETASAPVTVSDVVALLQRLRD